MKLTFREIETINSAIKRFQVNFDHNGVDCLEFIMPSAMPEVSRLKSDEPMSATCNISRVYLDRYGEIEVDIRNN